MQENKCCKGYSIWLIPRDIVEIPIDKAYKKLSSLIHKLSQKYKPQPTVSQQVWREIEKFGFSPYFFKPHVTLIKDLTGKKEDLIAKTKLLASKIQPYAIEFTKLDCCKNTGSLFLKIKETEAIMNANLKAQEIFNKKEKYFPHLSLMYSNFPAHLKEKITPEIEKEIQNLEFKVNSLHLYSTKGKPGEWHEIEKFPLGKMIKRFYGIYKEEMQELVEEGFTPANISDAMRADIERKLFWEKYHTIDGIALHNEKFKIVLDCDLLKTHETLTEEQYRSLKAEEFTEKDMIINRKLTEKEALNHLGWQILAREKNLLEKYVEETFKQAYLYNEKKAMGFFICGFPHISHAKLIFKGDGTPKPKIPLLRHFYIDDLLFEDINELEYCGADIHCSWPDMHACLIGKK